MNLSQQAQKLRDLKERRDALKGDYEDADKEFKAAEFELLERMEAEDCDGIKVGGTNFVPTETVYAQIQDRSEFIEWAEVQNDELIEPRERKALLNQFVREQLDNGKPLPPGLNFYVRRVVSQRAA
jgi:hypothetical protein